MVLDLSILESASERRKQHQESVGSVVKLIKQPGFLIPQVQNLSSFAKDVNAFIKPYHGTTTLAFAFQGGAIIAADSRATQGSYIASQEVNKILEITPFMLGTVAGGAADCKFWERYLGMKSRLYELENGKRITVRAASKILSQICFQYKDSGLSMGIILVGWNADGPGLYWVDSDAQRTSGQIFSAGSGSLYAYGVLDSGYKWDMTVEDAVELAKRSIFHATHRDSASGGTVSVYHMTKEGHKKVVGADVGSLFYEYSTVLAEPTID